MPRAAPQEVRGAEAAWVERLLAYDAACTRQLAALQAGHATALAAAREVHEAAAPQRAKASAQYLEQRCLEERLVRQVRLKGGQGRGEAAAGALDCFNDCGSSASETAAMWLALQQRSACRAQREGASSWVRTGSVPRGPRGGAGRGGAIRRRYGSDRRVTRSRVALEGVPAGGGACGRGGRADGACWARA